MVAKVIEVSEYLRDPVLEEIRGLAFTRRDIDVSGRRCGLWFPNGRMKVTAMLRDFWKIRDTLAVDDELVLHGSRIIILSALRRQVLARLHDSQCGIEATKRCGLATRVISTSYSLVKHGSPCYHLNPGNPRCMTRHHPALLRMFLQTLSHTLQNVICCMPIACLVGHTLGAMDGRLFKEQDQASAQLLCYCRSSSPSPY